MTKTNPKKINEQIKPRFNLFLTLWIVDGMQYKRKKNWLIST